MERLLALLPNPVSTEPGRGQSIEEQARIVAAIQRGAEHLDSLLADAVHSTTLLHERRSALVSAAVTGQIDVRDAVPVEVA